jgi:hypothetical protein
LIDFLARPDTSASLQKIRQTARENNAEINKIYNSIRNLKELSRKFQRKLMNIQTFLQAEPYEDLFFEFPEFLVTFLFSTQSDEKYLRKVFFMEKQNLQVI